MKPAILDKSELNAFKATLADDLRRYKMFLDPGEGLRETLQVAIISTISNALRRASTPEEQEIVKGTALSTITAEAATSRMTTDEANETVGMAKGAVLARVQLRKFNTSVYGFRSRLERAICEYFEAERAASIYTDFDGELWRQKTVLAVEKMAAIIAEELKKMPLMPDVVLEVALGKLRGYRDDGVMLFSGECPVPGEVIRNVIAIAKRR